MVTKDWIKEAVERICAEVVYDHLVDGPRTIRSIIAECCPFKPDTAYVPLLKLEPGHIVDWAARCAQYLDGERRTSVHRTAAVVAHFAEPLIKLVDECKRGHSKGYNEESADYPPCPKSREDGEDATCTCGADEWNAKVDAVLSGNDQ